MFKSNKYKKTSFVCVFVVFGKTILHNLITMNQTECEVIQKRSYDSQVNKWISW